METQVEFTRIKATRRGICKITGATPIPPVTSGSILTSVGAQVSPAGKPARVLGKCGADMASNESGGISEVKFLTVAEVASVMRVSKMTVYRLVHNGELPAVRVGRSFRVSEKDVDEYLKSSFYQTG